MPRTMDLAAFCAYVGEQCKAARQVYAEIEEVQYQFNEIYRQRLEAWQRALARTVPMLASPEALPPELAQSLLEEIEKERRRLSGEIASLEQQVSDKRAQAEAAAAQARDELAALRKMNPRLDADEERIKAHSAALRAEIEQLDQEIRAAGLIRRLLGCRRLRRQREERRGELAAAAGQLRRVREEWAGAKRRYESEQTRLHQLWEQASVEAANLQSRLDYLRANIEQLARQNGSGRWLAGLQAVPEVAEPLRGALSQVVEINRVKAEYEEGLRTVSEALGLLKGLAEGLERFLKSADKVLEEQEQYNLRKLRVRVADTVLDFHAIWPSFRTQVRDEKLLGAHPAEFSRRVRAVIGDSLGESAIGAMFESLGNSLTEATAAWG
ncbi:MAG: hypothetical protein K6V36_07740 [Anaerolineae bacterium]|nr:hypothetical protein [Anaerolineae bacterium]